MPQARRTLVSLDDTSYYHCIARCVRRAFLCGNDAATGRDYEHRRQWVVDRIALLTQAYTIDVGAYAVLSNHYHLVLHIDNDAAEQLSEDEVMDRWERIHSLPVLLVRYRDGDTTCEAENTKARKMLAELRARLWSLSWFMRDLNEFISRTANAEDQCTGAFWEARFKSQALLDEAALLTCINYVDLNPVRAAMAPTPEDSDYTSAQARIRAHRKPFVLSPDDPVPVRLMPFQEPGNVKATDLPFSFKDYLELLDWTGRAILDTKRGAIDADRPPILERLGINPEQYLRTMRRNGNGFRTAMGPVEALRAAARKLEKRCLRGISEAQLLFGTPAS